jgi:hypothetical protein
MNSEENFNFQSNQVNRKRLFEFFKNYRGILQHLMEEELPENSNSRLIIKVNVNF